VDESIGNIPRTLCDPDNMKLFESVINKLSQRFNDPNINVSIAVGTVLVVTSK
jgi:hypothetical protein